MALDHVEGYPFKSPVRPKDVALNLQKGQLYFIPHIDPCDPTMHRSYVWEDKDYNWKHLYARLVHLDPHSAAGHAYALIVGMGGYLPWQHQPYMGCKEIDEDGEIDNPLEIGDFRIVNSTQEQSLREWSCRNFALTGDSDD